MSHQQQPGEPFPVTLSRGGAPAFALSASKELAFGIDDGSLSPDAAAQLLTQEKADPNGRYYDTSLDRLDSLLHLAAEKCIGEDGAAMLECLIKDAGADVNFVDVVEAGNNRRPLDSLLARLRRADRRLLLALLPMIETLLRHGARCYFGGAGALQSLFASSAMEEVSATGCLEVVTRLTTAAAAAPTPPSLGGDFALSKACRCQFRQEEDQQQQQQEQQKRDGAYDSHADPHIAILEKLVEGMGRKVLEGFIAKEALNHAVDRQNRAVVYCQIASYVEPLPLPFSDRTPLGRRLNAALSFFVSRVCNVASPCERRRLFRHTAFVTPHTTHTDTSDSQGGGEGEGGQVGEGIVYGLRDVIHLIRCEEALHYQLPDIDSGFGNGKPFECAFDGRVVVGGAGGGQCVVQTIDRWEAMGERRPPGALWSEESSDDDDSSDDSDEDDDIDEDGMDEDGLEDAGDGDDLDEGFMAEDGMDGDLGEEDGDMIDDDDEPQHTEDDQSVDEMDEEHSSSDPLI
ncbi:unnamed protein product [Vitrella brassicaformis CCMP3155]|uniref:Uncharacterized protein n=1 Tax=Vitrella brassicaformis (strain CCMP3155) TaxID=1169540 RepID=A0A0G4EVD5_VITBC|nr:unnamed protein product [Vitrella brassicaformis CCMP3155]|eukprot:CEM02361.1 unnamed protein product [Vitrella brassicaformis CCMP3155]